MWRRVSIGTALSLLAVFLLAFAAGAQQVTLPLEQFEALRNRANPGAETPCPPPAPYALELADYRVRVSPESARVVQTLRLTLYDDQWQTVPLGEAGSFIGADFHGAEGRVEATGKGLVLHLRGHGEREVRLESATRVTRDPGATRPTWRFGLGFPGAAVVRGRIEAPASVEEVEPEGSGLVQKDPGGVGWTFVALPGTEVRWTLAGKAVLPERARLPLRFEATSATAAILSRTRLQVLGWIDARVAQGRLETLRIPVPAGLQVVAVRGPIAGWNVEGEQLIVTPLAPVENDLAVEIELTGEPRDRFATPLLAPEGSARTALLVKAALKGDGLLSLADRGATRPPGERDEARLPEPLRSVKARLFAVGDAGRPPVWEAAWAERTEVLAAQVDRLLVDVAVGEAGKATYQLWAEVRNRGAQQLTLTLPAGFELAGGRRDGVAVVPGSDRGSLAIPLLTQDEAQVVYLSGVIPLPLPRKDGPVQIPLPALSAPAARVEVRLLLPGGRSYELAEKARAGAVSPPPGAAARRPVSELGQQANVQINAGQAIALSSRAPSLFPRPAGFTEVDAAWSALSATPAPLAIRVEAEKEKREWF
jgi:hypothetical protein